MAIVSLTENKIKANSLLIITIIFFLLLTTSYYWEGNLGSFAIPVFFALLIVYIVLAIALLFQLYLLINERFKNRRRLMITATMLIALCLATLKPNGIIDFKRFESKDLLIAQREGSANCMTTLKLKQNKSFVESNVCFGTMETKGKYERHGDTIFFKDVKIGRGQTDYYLFAIIKPPLYKNERIIGDLVRYKGYKDTTGQSLWITRNDLVK